MDMGTSSMAMATSAAMSMAMSATSTAGSAAATTSSSMSDMDMDSSGCTISMLWNWNTVGSCFLAESWYIRTKADFGGTIVGILFLCMAIDFVRRLGREYDRRLNLQRKVQLSGTASTDEKESSIAQATPSGPVPWPQQVVRGLFYGSQFTAAFLVMLLGMYFNGYVLFAIFLGQTMGYIVFGRDTINLEGGDTVASGGCC